MTTGELIKVLADYCPDTPVEVQEVTVSPPSATTGVYPSYSDTTETLYLRYPVNEGCRE